MTRTLFIGLGRMGKPMVSNIAKRFDTEVYDIVPEVVTEVAAEIGATARFDLDDVRGIETVILMAPTSAHVESILIEDGLMNRLSSGSLIIDMGSSVPQSTQKLAAIALEHGIDYVDAPVSGGIIKAGSGELAMLVGGNNGAIERAHPYLECVGSDIVSVGESGAGHAAKSINNLVSATNMAVVTEALIRARSAGIKPERMVAVLNSSTGMSQASAVKFPKHILPEAYNSMFAYDLMLKDMGIATDIKTPEGATPITNVVFELLTRGRKELADNPDHTEITRVYERLFNLSVTDHSVSSNIAE